MNSEAALMLARRDRLYPSMIVHGGTADERLAVAENLGRAMLCGAAATERPCGECRHCRRIALDPDSEAFHPDFQILVRDLKTATSVEATKKFLRSCLQTPFEARGQVFVVAEAESLSAEAANALLKVLEEPPDKAPRHFFLLAPSRQDLLPTLRSRSWDIFLGSGTGVDREAVGALTDRLVECFEQCAPALVPLRIAAALEAAGDFKELRTEAPWSQAAAAVAQAALQLESPETRRRLLALAQDLLDAPRWRLRAIPAQRLLEGLAVRHLRGPYRVEPLALRV